MVYKVREVNTGRSFNVNRAEETSMNIVWLSVSHWFSKGAVVNITDEIGKTETFAKYI